MGKSTISMAIFNSYVKLPEGNLNTVLKQNSPATHSKTSLIMFESEIPPRQWRLDKLENQEPSGKRFMLQAALMSLPSRRSYLFSFCIKDFV